MSDQVYGGPEMQAYTAERERQFRKLHKVEDPPFELDPAEAVRVANLSAACERGTIELPGIGTATIISSGSRTKETVPPTRKTTLTIEFTHHA